MSDETTPKDGPRRRSSSAEAAATRWGQTHPEEDVDHDPPSAIPEEGGVPNRHSASAEAAALRWRERNSDDDDD